MNDLATELIQPLAYRVWDPKYRSFFYTDALPQDPDLVDRWTGLFDKQGLPLYENDIIRAHYDWRYGWVRALIVRDSTRHVYRAQATAPGSATLHIGSFSFADAYRIGNRREHPRKLVPATEQFSKTDSGQWWVSPAIFRSVASSAQN